MLLRGGGSAVHVAPAWPASLRAHAEALSVDSWERAEQPPFPQHRGAAQVTPLLCRRSPASPLPAEPLPGSPRAGPAPPHEDVTPPGPPLAGAALK